MATIGEGNRPAGAYSKYFTGQITRSTTSNQALFTLPANPTILSWRVSGSLVSNAATDARISIGCNSNERVFLSEFNVKTNGNLQSFPSSAPGSRGLISDPNPVNVIGRYDETGSASTAGGPWDVICEVL